MLFVSKNAFFITILILFHLPIFFINNSWDGSIIDYGFSIQDLSGIKTWYQESSSNFQFIIINCLFFVKNLFNFSNELIFDLFTLIFLVLFSYETQHYAKRVFSLSKNSSLACFIFALIYPAWNSLTEINLGLYLFCFYLALIGYRFFINKKLIVKFLGLTLLFCSFSIKSNFAFVLALPLVEYLQSFFQNKRGNLFVLIFITFLCVGSYLINNFYFPPYGSTSGYNQIQLSNLKIIEIFANLINYFSFLFYFTFIPIALFIYEKFKLKNKVSFFDKNFISNILVILLFFLLVISPYIVVQKSVDVFNFSNFDSRHAFLTAVPISIFLAIIINKISDSISYKKSQLMKYIIIFQSLLILSFSYFVKYNSTLVDKNLVKSFQNLKEPKSGYIIIYSDELIRNYYHLNNLLYKSFGKAAWLVEIDKKEKLNKFTNKEFYEKNYKEILSKQKYPVKHAMNNQSNKCLTYYQLSNEISTKEFFKKTYLLNQQEFFNLKKVHESC